MKTSSFLVTLYYALASIIGLVLSVIGAALFVNLILRSYILQIPQYPSMPPMPYEGNPTEIKNIEQKTLTEDDKAQLAAWKENYAQWQREQKAYDQASVDKKNQLATSVSMLAVGLPVLFFHQKELRKKNK